VRGFRPRTHFGLFVLCILLVALAWIRVRGQHIAASSRSSAPRAPVIEGAERLTTSSAKGATAEGPASSPLDDTGSQRPEREGVNRPGLYDIHGTIWHTDEDVLWEQLVKRLEAVESLEELKEEWKRLTEEGEPRPRRQPTADVVVTLRGSSLTRRVVTDAQGKFRFAALPRGEYELSAGKPVRSSTTGLERMMAVRKRVRLDKDSSVDLELRAGLVAVRGRITDVDGRPVAGAKIATEFDEPVNDLGQHIDSGELEKRHQRWVYASTRSTLSDAGGFYELQGLESTHFFKIFGYLGGGAPFILRWVTIRVEADGFVQGKDNVPKVPLLTEDGLHWGRRFLKAVARYSEEDLREKEDLALPSLEGNTITGIDIVLKEGVGAE